MITKRPLGFVLLLFASFLGQATLAAETVNKLDNIVVNSRSENLLGVADSASEGSTGGKELSYRTFARPGEVMETVPGLIVTQHDGGGKANQYFIRGFNLDHGTDLAFFLNGMPLNLPTNGHGQGYTDSNWLIPELVKLVKFRKGPYFAEYGDFANAGAVSIEYKAVLPQNIVSLASGNLGYYRALTAASQKVGTGNLLYALEYSHFDGAWDVKNDYKRINGVLTYSQGAELGANGTGYSASFMGYSGTWTGTEQVPQRAVDSGIIGRYGTLDPTVGGITHRISASTDWHTQDANSNSQINLYAVNYGLDLFSNFSGYTNQVNGDQIEQKDKRNYYGAAAKHNVNGTVFGLPTEHSFGLSSRRDITTVTLDKTESRSFLSGVNSADVKILNASSWYTNKTQWTNWFRTSAGARVDLFQFDVAANLSENSGNKTAAALSPKLNLIFGPFAKTEIYISGGMGLRSVDARSVFLRKDPSGNPSGHLPPVFRTRGAEIGFRNNSVPGLKTSIAFWALHTESETFFVSDAGEVQDTGQQGNRQGIEFLNYYDLNNWFVVDADFSSSQARFDRVAPGENGDHVPEAIASSLAASVTVHDGPICSGCFVNLRLRYFGPRDLTSDGSQTSKESTVLNLSSGYKLKDSYLVKFDILNLTNRKYNDAEYYDVSRLRGEALPAGTTGGIQDHLVHPGEPLSFRLGLVYNM